MKIIVCVKQVPATQNVKLDEETGVLLRAGVKSKLNPYDLFAIELSLELRERYGGEVTLLTMGPPQAAEALREGLRMGADRGVLLSDARFAGSDTLATSLALSGAIKALGNYDLILTGKQTTDGDTAQVGPEIAELLGLPHVSDADEIAKIIENFKYICLAHNAGDLRINLMLDMPCLLTVEKDVNTPRLPSYTRGKQLMEANITTLTLDDITSREEHISKCYGISGSPTHVVKVFPPAVAAERVMHEGGGETLGSMLAEQLLKSKIVAVE